MALRFSNTRSAHNPMFREGEFTNGQGLRIQTYDLQPTCVAKAHVILLHSFKSHSLHDFLGAVEPGGPHTAYHGTLLEALVEHDFGVWMMDFQSHGLSDDLLGVRSYIAEFQDLVDDTLMFISLVQTYCTSETAPISTTPAPIRPVGVSVPQVEIPPMFLCGDGLGGAVAVQCIRFNPLAARGTVLIAPMLSLERARDQCVNKMLQTVAETYARHFPTAKVVRAPKNTMFPLVQRELEQDPLCDTKTHVCARTALEFLKFTMDIMENCQEIVSPFLTLHSPRDTRVDPASSATLHRDASSLDKHYVECPDMWHNLLHENGKASVIDVIVSWIVKRCGSR